MTLMARDWEEVQKKVFTRWMNSYAKKRGFQIEDLETDFEDGIKLIKFMEAISGESLGRYNAKPRMKIQSIENLNTATDFIRSKGIRLNNIGSEDIHNGNLKLIMGLIWMLILRFQVEDITEGELRAKEALLLWCQRKTEPYNNVDIQDFHRSWQDGLGFCALIHAHRPGLIDYENLDANDPLTNLQTAFTVAEEHLGVDQLLDPEDIVNTAKPDERSIIAYVSSLYRVFAGDKQTEDAARRIKNLVEFMNLIDSMKSDFNGLASDLLEWIKQKIPYMTSRDYDGTLDHVKALIEEMKEYKSGEKIEKEKDKANLENILSQINLKLKNANRSAWEPETELTLENLDSLWDTLQSEETERDKWLRDLLNKKEKLEKYSGRFGDKASQLEKWIADKDKYLSKVEDVNSLNDAKNKLNKVQSFPKEYGISESKLNTVKQLCDQICELEAENADEVKQRTEKITSDWEALQGKYDSKVADLEEKVAIEQKKEDLRNAWAEAAQDYIIWGKKASNDISATEFGNTLEEVEGFQPTLEQSDNEYNNTSSEKKENLLDIWNQLQELGVKENPYSPYNIDDVEEVSSSLDEDLQTRKTAYEEELQRQRDMEAKRIEFAEAADNFVAHIDARKDAVKTAFEEPDLDTALANVESTWNNGEPENEPMNNLQKLANEMLKMGIRENRHTKLTMPALTKLRKGFDSESKDKLNILHDEKELKEEYMKKSTRLADWVSNTLQTIRKEFDNTLEGARTIYDEWNVYKSQESAESENDHQNLTLLYTKIQTLLEKNGRPAWEVTKDDLDTKFAELSTIEEEVETAITEELERQENIESLKRRFDLAASVLESFVSTKESFMNQEEEIESLNAARLYVKLLKVAQSEIRSKRRRLDDLNKLKEQIVELNYINSEEVTAIADQLNERFENLSSMGETKGEALQGSVSTEKSKESLRLKFAELARDFNRFVKQTTEELADTFFGVNLERVEKQGPKVDAWLDEIREKVETFKASFEENKNAMDEAGVTENKHTDLTLEDIAQLEADLNTSMENYKAAYDAELESQQNKDQRRIEWAALAQEFADWIDTQREQLNAVEGDLDEKEAKINEIYGSPEVGAEKLAAVQAQESANEEEGIFGNNHTGLSVSILQGRLKSLDSFVQNYLSEIATERRVEEKRVAAEAEAARRGAIETLESAFDAKEVDVTTWIEEAIDRNTDDHNVSTVEEIENIASELNAFAETAEDQRAAVEELKGIVSQLAELEVEKNFELAEELEQAISGIESKKVEIAEQVEYQKEQAQKSAEYAEKAAALAGALDEARELLNVQEDSLDVAISKTADAVARLEGQKDSLNGLELDWAELDEAHRADVSSFVEVQANYNALLENASSAYDTAVKEQAAKSGSNISPEDLKEFRETFDFFDKNKDGTLSALDFYGVLTALGETPTEESAAQLLQTLDTDGSGSVTFDEFSAYMISRRKDSDTQSQLEDSFVAVTGGADFITEEQLKLILPVEEVEKVISKMPAVEGGYDYRAWLATVYH
eukprot:TRINITY_DN424_c0_g1_i1.p1 TRINITY_DN424_c0_g1~~TRINITY_DN424_c0_g1_i1.p1  ORF type:complete len:1520 (-),score=544.89 TRINITY_DN424_c0_g1_i1:23-4582(-)